MECYKIQDLTFTYPEQQKEALNHITLTINQGEFITLCGTSGSGKSTLLKHLKTCFNPKGTCTGEVYFQGNKLSQLDQSQQTQKIGFVLQDPDSQIVTDKVWHELAFGLESLGYSSNEIRGRVAEMAAFFGIQNWFYKNTSELSGGQKQLLNLASIMALQPEILILDEPTSQLDPIAAQKFLEAIARINRELGTTILLSEHRLEEAFPLSDRVVVMEDGKIVTEGTPQETAEQLKEQKNDMFRALPTPMRIYAQVPNPYKCPLTIREGRHWLEQVALERPLNEEVIPEPVQEKLEGEPLVELQEVWFRYEKQGPDIIKNLNLKIYKGEIYAILGGNGAGKTTALSLISGINQPYRGRILYKGKKKIGLLPQNPKTLFVRPTLAEDLKEMFKDKKISEEEKQYYIDQMIQICSLQELMDRHPYDLSGGEQQRAALAKVLLLQPEILILDEPTKGMDIQHKIQLAHILRDLITYQEMTIILVSHDIEFCSTYATRCAMFFDGSIVSEETPRLFFSGKSFYTTAANRMSRSRLSHAVLAQDVILACGGQCTEEEPINKKAEYQPKTNINNKVKEPMQKEPMQKDNWLAYFIVLICVPLTIFAGITLFNDRKYYFISLLIILEIFIPFFIKIEKKKMEPRQLIVISVLCGIAVAGRVAFFMVPQFKPVAAIVILSGVCLGRETGFLVGALTAFVSNMFFGQGPWTPWQMFAFGILGFLAGILYENGPLKKTKLSISLYGGITTFLLYGGIMNTATVIMSQPHLKIAMFLSSYAMGIIFDLIHAASTILFLWCLTPPMLEKMTRIKKKYGISPS